MCIVHQWGNQFPKYVIFGYLQIGSYYVYLRLHLLQELFRSGANLATNILAANAFVGVELILIDTLMESDESEVAAVQHMTS